MKPARLRNVSTLATFLHDLRLLFRGSIYAWFPARGASCVEALILPTGEVQFYRGALQGR